MAVSPGRTLLITSTLGALTLGGVLIGCPARTVPEPRPPGGGTPRILVAPYEGTAEVTPVPLPDPGIPGFQFPTPAAEIDAWIVANDQTAMSKHGWGVWTALTSMTQQTHDGSPLRVYQTWVSPQDLASVGKAALSRQTRNPFRLMQVNQFRLHGARKRLNAVEGADVNPVVVTENYSPDAAQHVVDNQLLSATHLCGLMQQNQPSVPEFPNTAIALKPTYVAATPLVDNRYYMLKVWSGPPSTPQPYPSSAWPSCVWVDVQDTSTNPGSGQVDTTCDPSGKSRTAASTYPVGQFVSFTLNTSQAQALNQIRASAGSKATPASAGDLGLLVAMHVTTKEIRRWTWETFWWTPNPAAPPFPSSAAVAATRPAQLTGAPAHYAQCTAFSMLQPEQPVTGGKNSGAPVYCFNPYLEAGFGPDDLPDSIPLQYQGQTLANNVGVQTNCMSCHAQANFPSSGTNDSGQSFPCKTSNPSPPAYAGDRYVDLDDPEFKGTVQVDFLWSLEGNAQ